MEAENCCESDHTEQDQTLLQASHQLVHSPSGRLRQTLLFDDHYSIDDKENIEDTLLIQLLNKKSALRFFGVRHKSYQVDAITEMTTAEEKNAAKALRSRLQGYGLFFKLDDDRKGFVLQGINLSSEDHIAIGEPIQSHLMQLIDQTHSTSVMAGNL